MKTSMTVLLFASTTALAPMTALAARNAVVVNPTGGMRVTLSLPIVDDVDLTTPITSGRLELAPGEGLPVSGGRYFVLTHAALRFADFRIEREPFADKRMRDVAVQTREAVPFVATQSTPGVYQFTIPREEFVLRGTAFINGDLSAGYDKPSEDVTGTIDLNTGTFQARVRVPKHMDVDWCWPVGCSIDGHFTVELTGALGPDFDGDGVRDSVDNCRLVANADQSPVITPVVTPPADVTLASCTDTRIGTATAVDVCDRGPVSISNNAPSNFPVGTTTVTWTGRTAGGRTSTATQRVTVVDTTAPRFVIVPPPVTVTACGPVALGLPAAVDDCGSGAVTITNNAPASFPPGSTLVTWTATDAAGNKAYATQLVTVNDSTPPVFTHVPPAVTITQCVGGNFGQAQATDACGVTVTNNAPVKFPLAQTTVVTWTARDGAGNVTTATQNVSTELADHVSCCPHGTNIKAGTSGRDVLMGTSGSDCIVGRGGDDVIQALDGADFIAGGAGRDTINGGLGSDLIYGREGDDVIEGGPGNDTIHGGPGTDTCAGATGNNTITGCEISSGS